MTGEQRLPDELPDEHEPHGVTEGGDPVCWLEQVCDACGAMREDPAAAACARCGTPFPGPQAPTGSGSGSGTDGHC
ncbi:MAG: hypothetical protein FWE15_12070 [Actinomycetia bacterium]|nr:hypothetical protein [Actinomycetes bacterium]